MADQISLSEYIDRFMDEKVKVNKSEPRLKDVVCTSPIRAY